MQERGGRKAGSCLRLRLPREQTFESERGGRQASESHPSPLELAWAVADVLHLPLTQPREAGAVTSLLTNESKETRPAVMV